MSKRKAVRVDHIGDFPMDLPGVFQRVERRWWSDGSSCLHVAKWGPRPGDGRVIPWWPPQYTQIPWELGESFLERALEGFHKAKKQQKIVKNTS